ncbi:MAG: methyltransferase domain-containing protein [Polaromonas sp.]|uniref:class I SAM-dependent methyltransferase n=1 Tax=Polaromonas sp. TaxID=1869339 RepID=UPI001802F636|nr:class I SAM-dependent methyltransferase [Polaromonas sp.]MBA3592615.1 methyltransferase domain-containing protein [Polaromonas sp.]
MTEHLKQPSLDALLDDVAQYYTRKINTHGATPLGVDWSCVPTQQMRFVHLLKLCSFESATSLNDVGCGYGAVLAFLAKRFRGTAIDYLGLDISPAMITQAQKLWQKRIGTKFLIASTSPRTADYSIASGIFNVKLKQPIDLWELFVAKSLANMHSTSRRGFAVNFLTPTSAQSLPVPELYYAQPDVWREYCERTFNSKVEVIAGYGLREYTLIARSS